MCGAQVVPEDKEMIDMRERERGRESGEDKSKRGGERKRAGREKRGEDREGEVRRGEETRRERQISDGSGK